MHLSKDLSGTKEHLDQVWKQMENVVAVVLWILFSAGDRTPDSVL